jgi:hypothetical protein
MNAKYWFLVTVVGGLLAWAGVETKRLVVAKKQLAASLELQKATTQRVEIAHLKRAHAMVE